METFRTIIDKKLARCEEIEYNVKQIIHDYNAFIDHGCLKATLTLSLPGGGMLDSRIDLTDDKAVEAVVNAIISHYRNELNDVKASIDKAFDEYVRKY